MHLYFKIFFALFPWDVILKFRDKIEKMEKDVYAVLQLEAEEKEMQKSEAQVSRSVSRPHRPLLVCHLLGCVCQTCHQSPRHLQAVASCSRRVLCYQVWFHPSAVPTDQHSTAAPGEREGGIKPWAWAELVPDQGREEEGKKYVGEVPLKAKRGINIGPSSSTPRSMP